MNIFIVDLKRAIISKTMLVSILLGLTAIILGTIMVPVKSAIDLYLSHPTDISEIQKMNLIGNDFNKVTLWNFGNYYYALIMPLICCIPFTVTYVTDKNSGFNKYIIIRGSYKNYIFSKIVTTFISGFLTIFITSVISYIIILLVDSGEEFRSIFYKNILIEALWNNNFDLFVIIYTIICSLMGGIYALIGLAISSLINNKLIALISPFMIYYIGSYISASIANIKISPMVVNKFYRYEGVGGLPIIIQLVFLLIISVLIFLYKTYWSECFE